MVNFNVLIGERMFIVMDIDGHSDPTAYPFLDRDDAIEFARSEARERNSDRSTPESLDERLTLGMQSSGWVYYCCYSSEGDALWVIERDLR